VGDTKISAISRTSATDEAQKFGRRVYESVRECIVCANDPDFQKLTRFAVSRAQLTIRGVDQDGLPSLCADIKFTISPWGERSVTR
jgi:hypothetical protein